MLVIYISRDYLSTKFEKRHRGCGFPRHRAAPVNQATIRSLEQNPARIFSIRKAIK